MKIGMTLSGGGARGVAHLGILKALDEANIKPSIMSGTSAGSIVGALYSKGYKPVEILEIIASTSFFKLIKPAFTLGGLLKIEKSINLYKKYLPEDTFESLPIPLTIVATDLHTGDAVYFSKGELIKPILASCCLPGIFVPIQIDGKYLIDGGIVDNLPTAIIRDQCDFLIGIHTNHCDPMQNLKNMRLILERTSLLAVYNNVKHSKTLCDFIIEPENLSRFSGFDVKKAKEIFQIGYDYTLKILPNLLTTLEKHDKEKSN